ncbi:hypothetical protein ACLOJK_041485 [Asimina triloba]
MKHQPDSNLKWPPWKINVQQLITKPIFPRHQIETKSATTAVSNPAPAIEENSISSIVDKEP